MMVPYSKQKEDKNTRDSTDLVWWWEEYNILLLLLINMHFFLTLPFSDKKLSYEVIIITATHMPLLAHTMFHSKKTG